VVTTGTPEEVAAYPNSYTGRYLQEVLQVSTPTQRQADKTALVSG
jgi:excinuclease UvrABC ATPase subunit